MTKPSPTFWTSYGTFVGVALGVAAAVTLFGYLPARRWLGDAALPAILAGCGASWLASCVGALPIASAMGGASRNAGTAILTSTAVRFVTVLVVVAPVALSGWVNRAGFVVFVGVSYVLTLLVDTMLAVRLMKRLFDDE